MAKVIIPDRICPHCGGNEWYENASYKNGKLSCYYYSCVKRVLDQMKIYYKDNQAEIDTKHEIYDKTPKGRQMRKKCMNKQTKSLGKHYILDVIALYLRNQGIKLDRSTVTEEDIEVYRQGLLVRRKLQQLKNNQKSKV